MRVVLRLQLFCGVILSQRAKEMMARAFSMSCHAGCHQGVTQPEEGDGFVLCPTLVVVHRRDEGTEPRVKRRDATCN